MTQAENNRRQRHWHAEKTHCPQGHPYDEANTYVHGTSRYCRECTNRKGREYRARKRQRVVISTCSAQGHSTTIPAAGIT